MLFFSCWVHERTGQIKKRFPLQCWITVFLLRVYSTKHLKSGVWCWTWTSFTSCVPYGLCSALNGGTSVPGNLIYHLQASFIVKNDRQGAVEKRFHTLSVALPPDSLCSGGVEKTKAAAAVFEVLFEGSECNWLPSSHLNILLRGLYEDVWMCCIVSTWKNSPVIFFD